MAEESHRRIPNYAVLKSQLRGISSSIDEYTSDGPITATRTLLEDALESRDRDSLLFACNEMLAWYKKNIDKIRSNSFVFNVESHESNIEQLSKSIKTIEENPEWFFAPASSPEPFSGDRKKMIFISHSTRDSQYVELLVDLLRKIGFTEENLFCSSYPGYGIPLGKSIYSFLKDCFTDYELYVLFVISESNYYSSPASLNEMGAAWVQGTKTIPILLPGMSPLKLRGVVGPDSLSLVLDSNGAKYGLNNLKNELLLFFGMQQINESAWERDRDSFLDSCRAIQPLSSEEIAAVELADQNSNLDDLIEENVSLEQSLYRALVIAKERGEKPLEQWIQNELKGYDNIDSVPDYRKVISRSFRYSGFNGNTQVTKAPLPLGFISDDMMTKIEEVIIVQGIGQVEDFAKSSSNITIDRSFLAGEVSRNTDGVVRCVVLEQMLTPAFFASIVACVKDRLIDVFMSMS